MGAHVLVRGAGDVGSAVAVLLYRAGYAVALHDAPQPVTPRRGMAFTDAVFDGSATLDGVPVAVRTKVIEIDPRGDPAAAVGLGARPRRIAEGVVRAMVRMTVPA